MSMLQLDAATSQKELETFDSLYSHGGSSHASSAIAEKPKDSIDVARKPKRNTIERMSSFTSDLDDLLNDVL